MYKKKLNLVIFVDFMICGEVLSLVDKVGLYVCIVKIYVDIFEDFILGFVEFFYKFVEKYNFVIFEDRKFVDIGNIVKNQYSKGLYYIVDWVYLVNVYVVLGDGVIKGFKEIGEFFGRACFLIGEMSFVGSLVIGDYIKVVVEMVKIYKDFVIGFISLLCLVDDFLFIYMILGVQFSVGGDNFG